MIERNGNPAIVRSDIAMKWNRWFSSLAGRKHPITFLEGENLGHSFGRPVYRGMTNEPISGECPDSPEHGDRDQSARGTADFLMKIIHSKGELPAFSSHIVEINTKLSSLTSVNFSSAGDLAKIILKDFSLTNRLLKIVNSALYAGQSGKVTTISKAMFLLGIEKIRIMAATLMIFDHLENNSQVKELQEIASTSLMSGLVAASVAAKMKMADKEEVFICSMLFNLGKMLVICYFPDKYEEIKRRMVDLELDEVKASTSVLGVSYNDLGMAFRGPGIFPIKLSEVWSPCPITPGSAENGMGEPAASVQLFQRIALQLDQRSILRTGRGPFICIEALWEENPDPAG